MKDQYFGDINDYRKYGLLRLLSDFGSTPTTVCWMRTPSDGRRDGSSIAYLQDAPHWRAYDPELYDFLKACLFEQKRRAVGCARDILPGTLFVEEILSDDAADRSAWFGLCASASRSSSLIFLDPDNGIEVASVPLGRKGSSRYLYWRELDQFWEAGKSILIYQHFPRVERSAFIRRMVDGIFDHIPASLCISFQTSRVLFVLLPQASMEASFDRRSAEVARRWAGQFTVMRFVRTADGTCQLERTL